MALEEVERSITGRFGLPPSPKAERLADGEEDGEAGEDPTRLLRFAGGRAGGAGESQKNEPRPGDPNEEAPLNPEGEGGNGARGESISIPFDGATLGEGPGIGSDCLRGSDLGSETTSDLLGRTSVRDIPGAWKESLGMKFPSFDDVHCIGIPARCFEEIGVVPLGGSILPFPFGFAAVVPKGLAAFVESSLPNTLTDPKSRLVLTLLSAASPK